MRLSRTRFSENIAARKSECQRWGRQSTTRAARGQADGGANDFERALSRRRVIKRPSARTTLPNLLVYVDLRAGAPTSPTLFAISEARRIARLAGASIFAVAAAPSLSTEAVGALAAPLATAGADKLLLCEADEFAEPLDDAKHGRALDAAVARVPPMLVLFPAGGSGTVLGPSLAARVGGPFAPWSDFMISDAERPAREGRSRVQVVRLRPDGRSQRRLDPAQIERPIVVTLCAGRPPSPRGHEGNLEIEVLPLPPRPGRPAPQAACRGGNTFARLQQASVLVLVGDCDPAQRRALDQVAGHLTPGAFVARASDVPASVLASCCPEIVIKVGQSAAMTARSPRTRIVLAATLAPDEVPPEDIDFVWSPPATAGIADLLRRLGCVS